MRPEIEFGVAGLLFLLLLLWGPTAQVNRIQFVIPAVLVLALGVEILRRQAARGISRRGARRLERLCAEHIARMRGRSEPPEPAP